MRECSCVCLCACEWSTSRVVQAPTRLPSPLKCSAEGVSELLVRLYAGRHRHVFEGMTFTVRVKSGRKKETGQGLREPKIDPRTRDRVCVCVCVCASACQPLPPIIQLQTLSPPAPASD